MSEPEPSHPDLADGDVAQGRTDPPERFGGLASIGFERHRGDGASVLEVVIDRPGDPLNRVDGQVHHDLTQLFARALHEETEARAILLTADGSAFSAGGDFAWFPTLQGPRQAAALAEDAKALIYGLLDVPLPIVCAVGGPAIGLGASIALLCDVIFMGRSASIADPHVRVGITAGDGGTVAWPLAVGPARAKRYLLTGDPVAAEEAERIGLVTHVVDDDDLHAEALAFAVRLAAGAPLAIRSTKAAVNATVKADCAVAFEQAVKAEIGTFDSDDHREALAALAQRRPPTFHGQ